MHRRYNRWHMRFDQPDPYDGSYDMTNPQSFNRYSYVLNDPVNFVDPLGLDPLGALGALAGTLIGMGPPPATVNVPFSSNEFEIETEPVPIGPGGSSGGGGAQNPGQRPLDTSQTERLLTGDCVHFLNSILAELGKIVDPYSYNFLGIFRKAKDQRPLYTKRMTPEERQRHRGVGGTYSIVGDPAFYIWIDEYQAYESGDNGYTLIHELFHGAAGSGTGYTHTDMANAAYRAASANPALMKEVQRHGIKEPRLVRYTREGYVEGDDFFNASVFDNILRLGCPQPE
jgi:hypothetical protein